LTRDQGGGILRQRCAEVWEMLREKADIRTLGFVATYFALFVVMWVWSPSEWYLIAPLFLATCAFSWFCAVIVHNTIHCALFTRRWANKLFQVVLTLTYGHPVSSYVSGHNLSHHRYTQKDQDVMRTSKVRTRFNLLAFLLFFPTVSKPIMKGDFAFARAMWRQRPRWVKQFALELGVLAVITVALFVIDWKKALIYWMIPHLWAQWGIVSINYFQHDGCDEDSQYNHSRNFVGRFFGWWTFNNGFHTVHHMYPNLHWSKLREVHDREVHPHIHPNLEERSIAAYAFKALIWPGKRVMYDGRPIELPPKVPDRSWIPTSRRDMPDVSLGAEV